MWHFYPFVHCSVQPWATSGNIFVKVQHVWSKFCEGPCTASKKENLKNVLRFVHYGNRWYIYIYSGNVFYLKDVLFVVDCSQLNVNLASLLLWWYPETCRGHCRSRTSRKFRCRQRIRCRVIALLSSENQRNDRSVGLGWFWFVCPVFEIDFISRHSVFLFEV